MLTKQQQRQAIGLQDAIGSLVDGALRDGLPPGIIREVLNDEASQIEERLAAIEMSPAPISQERAA